MAGQRQPVELILAKGAKNLTKSEIAKRKATEIQAPDDKVRAPGYLTKEQKKEFNRYAKQLKEVGIISNLDCDALARFVVSQSQYLFVNRQTNQFMALLEQLEIDMEELVLTGDDPDALTELTKRLMAAQGNLEWAMKLQDKQFKQCSKASADLGLTISSRCRLVIPKAKKEESQPENEGERLFGRCV